MTMTILGTRPVAARDASAAAALEELYAAHWQQLVRLSVLLGRGPGRAEDVVQDAFVAVYRRWHRLRDPQEALAHLRKVVVTSSRSASAHPEPTDPDAASVPASAAADLILAAVHALPQREREVVALRYYLELPVAEVASTLGIRQEAVSSRASRGMAALRRSLGYPPATVAGRAAPHPRESS